MDIKERLELKVEDLKKFINPLEFEFETTEETIPLEGIIGQERAVKAVEFGLAIKRKGYNIFMSGITGTGKTSYAKTILEKKAKTDKVPDDICYIYNFKKNSNPIVVTLPRGKGKEFKKDMDFFREEIQDSILKVFSGDEYDEKKKQLFDLFKKKRQHKMQELYEFAENLGFILKGSNTGYLSIPIIDGKEIDAETYESLNDKTKKEIEDKSLKVQEKAVDILKEVQSYEKEAKIKLKELQDSLALIAIGDIIDALKTKYEEFELLKQYFDDIKNNILENINHFLEPKEDTGIPFPWIKKNHKEEILYNYQVNLIIDNSEEKGAPVYFEPNPTYHNLVGRIEYENEMGTVTTDYMKIKAGAIHKANGGYLILQARDILTMPFAWDALKRIVSTERVNIDDLREQYGAIIITSLKPEPVETNLKIVLIGSPHIYYLLYNYDEDFRKLFKIKADFDAEMDLNRSHLSKMSKFVSSICKKENVRHFDRTGLAKLIEYSTRLSANQEKLSTRFNELVEIIFEANAYAEMENKKYIDASLILKALKEKDYRRNSYQEKLNEYIMKDNILIDTEGSVVGQINGLAVLSLGDFSFGKPNRITASTYMGRNGIINIERETRMSGRIHDKGVLILTGYLGCKYAQERPLNLSASLCFEQLYGGIDGDSASSTELYVLLSSLAEVPIEQGIAVTGSVNQKGEIQPIGGVTEKIEGFFDICYQRGLTGEQGVMIPKQNIKDLVLKEEVIQAVKEGKFHIYAVSKIDEGIEILTGIKAGEKDKHGIYEEGTINYLVLKKLEKLQNLAKKIERRSKAGNGTRINKKRHN